MIYFIQGEQTKLVKIGKTRNVWNRIEQMQSLSPDLLNVVAVMNPAEAKTDAQREAELHRRFFSYNVHGEWFEGAPVIKYVKILIDSGEAYVPELCEGGTRPVHIPIKLHERIKVHAAEEGVTMGHAVEMVILDSRFGSPLKKTKEQK